MKFVKYLFVLIPFFSIAQKNDVEKKSLKWFRNVYVEENFKDPYSFKLLKISSVSKTVEGFYKSVLIKPGLNFVSEIDNFYDDDLIIAKLDTAEINQKISLNASLRDNPNATETLREKYNNNLKALVNCKKFMIELINMKSDIKKIIGANLISIDFYANNSYGMKILNKYSFYYFPKNSPFYNSKNKFSYNDFMVDENLLFKQN